MKLLLCLALVFAHQGFLQSNELSDEGTDAYQDPIYYVDAVDSLIKFQPDLVTEANSPQNDPLILKPTLEVDSIYYYDYVVPNQS